MEIGDRVEEEDGSGKGITREGEGCDGCDVRDGMVIARDMLVV